MEDNQPHGVATVHADHDALLVGIDVGTTHLKVIVFDDTGRMVAGAKAPTPTCYPRPGWAHFDPDEIWEVTAGLLRAVTMPDR